jgi:2-methylisocitrate lyase-like PEP mutase family enzyme
MNDQIDVASKITKIIDIPLVVDGDAGWGGLLQTRRTVREFEHAGVAAFHFEDHLVPKPMSYYKRFEVDVIERADFLSKISAALAARRNPDTVIIGRTDAFAAKSGSRQEAIERGAAMLDAGVDLVFFSGVKEREDVLAIRRAVPNAPMFTIALGDQPLNFYRELGFRMVIFPNGSVAATHRAVTDVYTSLYSKGLLSYSPHEYEETWRGILETLRVPDLWELEETTD